MKKIFLLLTAIVLAGCSDAQQKDAAQKASTATQPKDSAAPKSADSTIKPLPIPAFRVLTADSTFFTQADIKKDKPVMMVYFSPDCSHCQRMMYELKPKLAEIKNVQVVMVTWSNKYDIRGIKEFRRDFDLKKYPNIVLGTEGYTMKVQSYYKVKTTPFIAMYNAGGKWARYFDKVPKSADVLEAAKALK